MLCFEIIHIDLHKSNKLRHSIDRYQIVSMKFIVFNLSVRKKVVSYIYYVYKCLFLHLQLKREIVGFKSSLSKHQMNSFSNKEDNCIGCCEANKLMISELRYIFEFLKLH